MVIEEWNPFDTEGQTDVWWHDSSHARKCRRSRRHSSLLSGNRPQSQLLHERLHNSQTKAEDAGHVPSSSSSSRGTRKKQTEIQAQLPRIFLSSLFPSLCSHFFSLLFRSLKCLPLAGIKTRASSKFFSHSVRTRLPNFTVTCPAASDIKPSNEQSF